MADTNEPGIDGDRLWRSLMDMARIGATEKGGVCRLALTDIDREGRDLFCEWAAAAGCAIRIDAIGNLFARRAGRQDDLPPVLVGSHLDSQPTGGKFDGVYGVLAGLEVLRGLNDAGAETIRPIEVVSWTNEEGARFPPAMMGSGVFAGQLSADKVLATADQDGRTVAEALSAIGYGGSEPIGGRQLDSYFEAHIEQGPILEAEDKVIGVVDGIQGIRWFDCLVTGTEAHAGPTPMTSRQDALVTASRLVQAAQAIAHDHGPDGRATVGQFSVYPNSRNVIPGRVAFTVDMRHPDADHLGAMAAALKAQCLGGPADQGSDGRTDGPVTIEEIWYSPPTRFDPDCVGLVESAAKRLGLRHRRITSGAGHDAKYLADICPTAMIFVPCKDGLSHNERESAKAEDLAAGCRVLMAAVFERANRPA